MRLNSWTLTARWCGILVGLAACSSPDDESSDDPTDADAVATAAQPAPNLAPIADPDPVNPGTAGEVPDATMTPTTAPSTPTTPGTPTENPPNEMPNPAASPPPPSVQGDVYTLSTSEQVLTLVANGTTGRVTSLALGATELLTDENVNPLNYGSSFWTSPQSTWNWPPPLDDTPYTHQVDGDSVLFTSDSTQQGAELVSITKRFRAMADHFVLSYTMTNQGAAAINVAPWEVTRVKSSGLSFYPTGSSITQEQLTTTQLDGITWLDYDNAGINGSGLKNATDGTEGWLAHVDAGILFLKRFDDVPADQQAPAEGEIEIYADGGRAYIELEQQGPYVTLQPQETSVEWAVRWYVIPLPAELDTSLGSAALVDYVRNL